MYCGTTTGTLTCRVIDPWYTTDTSYHDGTSYTGTAMPYWARRMYSTWQPIARLVPKNWRWYHVFFDWLELVVPQIKATYGVVRRFIQDRFSLKEKARRKRRAFVQALHAA